MKNQTHSILCSSASMAGAAHRLAELEEIIRSGNPRRPEARICLSQVMKERLYLERGFFSHAEYCQAVWEFNPNREYQPAQSTATVGEPKPTPSHHAASESRQVTEPATNPLVQAEIVMPKSITVKSTVDTVSKIPVIRPRKWKSKTTNAIVTSVHHEQFELFAPRGVYMVGLAGNPITDIKQTSQRGGGLLYE